MAITETWTNDSIENSVLIIDGYNLLIRRDRQDTMYGRGGGIIVYTKKELNCYEIPTPLDIIQAISLGIKLDKEDLHMYIVYRSPNSSLENNSKINNFINSVKDNSIIVGDFNYPDINWELLTGTLHTQEFLDVLSEKHLNQHVTFPTHQAGNILDLVLSNVPNLIQSLKEAGKLGNSDHTALEVVIQADNTIKIPKHTVWNFAKARFQEMKYELSTIHWRDHFTNNIEANWATFEAMFSEICNKYVPKKSVKQMKRPAWLKQETLTLIRQKRAAWKRYRGTKNQNDFLVYKLLEKKVHKAVKKAKHRHEVNIAKNAKTNPKLFYAYLNTKKGNKISVGPVKDESGNFCNDDGETANILNNHYSRMFTAEDPQLPEQPPDFTCTEMDEPIITRRRIVEVLQHMKKSCSPGPDGISQRILIEVAEEISYPLYLLFKESLDSAQLPEEWKVAHVIPIFKKGSKSDPANYRPISLTSVVVKLLERMLKESIMSHLISNKLIKPSQHGFMPKRSTTTNLVTYLDYVTKQLDSGHSVDILYLDFAKAFDKVPHQRLIQKLKCHKINPKVIAWISSWLHNRKQRVSVNGTVSEWIDVLSSVVQGSVLGPILFIIFINDIDLCLGDFEAFMSKFADDTKIAKIVNDNSTAAEMQTIISRLEEWSIKWGMQFNASKCFIIHLGYHNQKFKYRMAGQIISTTSDQRDLGIFIDDSCKPGLQCAIAAKKANQVLGRINRSFSCYTRDVMLQIYKVFVRPNLEYAVSAWSPWLAKDINVLESIQHRATRRISDVHGSYPERLQQLQLTTLEERRIRGDAIEMFKYLHGNWDIDFTTMFTTDNPERQITRQQQSYMPVRVPRARLDLRKNFFCVRGPQTWNSLPSEMRQSSSLNAFKNAFDQLPRNI